MTSNLIKIFLYLQSRLEPRLKPTGVELPSNLFAFPKRQTVIDPGMALPNMNQGQVVDDVEIRGVLKNRKIKGVIFRNVTFPKILKRLTFSECRFLGCRFVGARFAEVEFHKCDLLDCNLWKVRFDDVYLDPRRIAFSNRYREEAANVGISVYQALIANFAKSRQQDFLRYADIRFQRWLRYQIPRNLKDGNLKPAESIWGWVSNAASDRILGYGYSPGRIIGATFALFLVTASINHLLISHRLSVNNLPVTDPTFIDSVFYTFSMLTVLGFSSIFPADEWAKLLTVFEVVGAIGWLGILTSVFVKRYVP